MLPCCLGAQPLSHEIRVLFLGNSYTYVNNLPALVASIAQSTGDTLIYDSNCIGGYTFNDHCSDATSLAKIATGGWNYIVLQAQSQEPSFSPQQVSVQTLPYAIRLDSLIKHYNPCAHTVFYETWGRKFGDQSNCAAYPPICTYNGMQNRLRDSYRMFADTVHDLMAPVGEAWRLAIATNTALDLYQADQSHPVLEGSYLAAAVFYETSFRRNVLTSTYNPGIGSGTLSLLQQCAHQFVSDSAAITNIPKYEVKASFSVVTQGMSVQLQSGTPGLSHIWYFDDGGTSSQVNASHTFSTTGTHTISLAIHYANGCLGDSVSKVISVSLATGLQEESDAILLLYPNPCRERLTITGKTFEKGTRIEVRNILGELCYEGDFTNELNTSHYKEGLYYIRIYGAEEILNSCFIKNE